MEVYSLAGLAQSCQESGMLKEAILAHEGLLPICEATYGRTSLETELTVGKLCSLYEQQQSIQQLVLMANKLVAIRKELYGEGSSRLALAYMSLACAEQGLGGDEHTSAAQRHFRKAYSLFQQDPGRKYTAQAVDSLYGLAQTCVSLKELGEAERNLERAVTLLKSCRDYSGKNEKLRSLRLALMELKRKGSTQGKEGDSR